MFIYTMRDICAWNDRKLRIDNWMESITPFSFFLFIARGHTYVTYAQSYSMVLVDPRRNSEPWIPRYLHCHRDKGEEESRLDVYRCVFCPLMRFPSSGKRRVCCGPGSIICGRHVTSCVTYVSISNYWLLCIKIIRRIKNISKIRLVCILRLYTYFFNSKLLTINRKIFRQYNSYLLHCQNYP